MRKMIWILLLLVPALLLGACSGTIEWEPTGKAPEESPEEQTEEPAAPTVFSDTLYVKAIPELPEDFILGMDVSSVIAEEASGVKYYDFDGKEQDLFRILADNGITHIRVRVWNHPYDEEGRGFGGGNCDIEKAAEIGRRAAQYGLKLIVDFHYSDFWADPGKQMPPLDWQDMDIEAKAAAVYQYTGDCLQRLKDAGAEVGMVQLGNETNGALCGETAWFMIQELLQAGSKATREACPDALIAVHFANPENADSYASYAFKLDYYSVDYDVFASSYYPYWHGTLDNLSAVLGSVAETYGKKVMVMETSYAYTEEDTDFFGNTIGAGGGVAKPFPYTVQGQANSVREVVNTVAQLPTGIGVCYWEGAWISVGQESWEENSAKWEEFGSGWAASYAAAYDPDDAGKWFGGCAVDNQAFFDPTGRPLESLKLFGLLRCGNEPTPVPDALEDVELTVDLNGAIELPETINAVMTDNSRRAVPVTWEIDEAGLQEMAGGGPAQYEIRGEANGMPARAYVNMVEFNYLENPGFESGELAPWRVKDLAEADQLYVEEKSSDSLSGSWHMHFWSEKKDSVEFTLEQTVSGLQSGKYRFSISIMGGDCGKTEIYAYVKLDGEEIGKAPMRVSGFGKWDTGSVGPFDYQEGQKLVVGVYVKCSGDEKGAWGKIDDAALNSAS